MSRETAAVFREIQDDMAKFPSLDYVPLMRRAKNYGIVDCQLLHGRYLHRMSPEAMAFYLFLTVVSDREGRSYYGDRTIQEILRFTPAQYEGALEGLISLKLVDYRRPYFWLKNLEVSCERRSFPKDQVPEGGQRTDLPSDRIGGWHTAKEGLQNLLRSLAHD